MCLKNYRLVDPDASLEFITRVHYQHLMDNGADEVPMSFFRKFIGIREVCAEGPIQDPNHFLDFLNCLESLRSLDFKNVRLGQEVFDRLPESACSLAKLVLREEDQNEKLNFDFIGKCSRLSSLRIYHHLEFESLISLARHLDKLARVSFEYRSKKASFQIDKKENSKKWKVYQRDSYFLNSDCVRLVTENPSEMVTFFERFQSGAVQARSQVDLLDEQFELVGLFD